MITAPLRALLACLVFLALTCCAFAQTHTPVAAAVTHGANPPAPASQQTPDATPLDDVRKELQEQRAEIERLRATLAEQSKLLNELLARTARTETSAATVKDLRNARRVRRVFFVFTVFSTRRWKSRKAGDSLPDVARE